MSEFSDGRDRPWRPAANFQTLAARARLLARIRAWFDRAGVMEVTTPLITDSGVTDVQIESVALTDDRYLRTSPEYFHKRLLAAGYGDIYELGPVFRAGDQGRLHQQEFTLLEWYRVGWSWQALAEETAGLLRACLDRDDMPVGYRSWRECFHAGVGVDALAADDSEIHDAAADAPPGCTRAMLLDFLFATRVQPHFEPDAITIVHDYPAEQAALARRKPGDPRLAERFEVFVGPVELANGYRELTDAIEQQARFEADNAQRKVLGRRTMPLDCRLLAALQTGLPECSGIALGVDRLVMIAAGCSDLASVTAFPTPRR